MEKPDTAFTLNSEQGSELIKRLTEKTIAQDDYETLIKIVRCYFWLILSLSEAKISMRRFKEMIFGRKKSKSKKAKTTIQQGDKTTNRSPTDSQDNARRDDDKTDGSKVTDAVKPHGDKTPIKGHGRLDADAYTGATTVECKHTTYTVGMPCPDGHGQCGTLHRYNDGVTIIVDGFSSLQATRYRCEKLQCSGCRTIYTASLPAGVNPKEKYTARAKATLAVLHYGLAVPFNRLERHQRMMGVPLPDATQWDQVEKCANGIYPAFDYLIYLAAQAALIYQDDTWVRILSLIKQNDNADKGARTGMYSTALVAQTAGHTVVLFFSGRRHAGENMDRLLEIRPVDLSPLIKMSDALNANNPSIKKDQVINSNCNVHALRKFTEIEDFFPQAAREVIDRFKAVFENERLVKADNLTDDERLVYHQKHSEPKMLEIKTFVEQQLNDKAAEPRSSLYKAYQYLINHWEKLTQFLITPGAPLDNNIVERSLKWMIQVRNNSHFFATEHGAYVGSMLMSLIATCSFAKINPIDYLVALQNHRSALFQQPEKWLPWNYHLNNRDPFTT